MSNVPFTDGDVDLDVLVGGKLPSVPLGPVVTASTPLPLGLNIGATYNHPRDFDRLSNNRHRALLIMLDYRKHSNEELSRKPPEGGAGLQGLRRIRDLTGDVWGPFRITLAEDEHGLVWYTLDPSSVTQRKLDKVFQNKPDEVEPLKLLRARVRKLALTASEGVLHQVAAALEMRTRMLTRRPLWACPQPRRPCLPLSIMTSWTAWKGKVRLHQGGSPPCGPKARFDIN